MGTNRANPAAMILSATMMLRHLGFVHRLLPYSILTTCSRLDSIANNIAAATFGVINNGKVRTADMGGMHCIQSIKNFGSTPRIQVQPLRQNSPRRLSRTSNEYHSCLGAIIYLILDA